MVNPNRLLLENALKSSFVFVVCLVNQYGEEKEFSYKKSRRKFFDEFDITGYHVTLVDDYPPRDMELDKIYVKRSGKIMWLKTQEKDLQL